MSEVRIGRVTLRKGTGYYATVFLLPTVLILAFVIFYPMVKVIGTGFFQAHLMKPDAQVFIGLENFRRLLSDPVFGQAVVNTILFALFTVVGGLVLGFALALVMDQELPLRNVFRGAALVPWVIPEVIVGFLALYMFNGEVGIINYTLKQLGLINEFIPWLGVTSHALPALTLTNIWNKTPFFMLMLLATLQTLPQDLVEQSKIDGANAVQRFRHVTIPHVKPTLIATTTLMVIWTFNNFDIMWATTQGGPISATMTLSVYTYRLTFLSFRLGYASAIGILWLLALVIFARFYIRALEGASND